MTDESWKEDSGEAAQQDWERNLQVINAEGMADEGSSREEVTHGISIAVPHVIFQDGMENG